MNVVLIGYGNTASVLGKCIINAGHRIIQVVGRNEAKAAALAAQLGAHQSGTSDKMIADADIYIIAISDDGIDAYTASFSFENQLVVHTSGAVSMEALKNLSPNYGVLYPLQSLSKAADTLPEIPLLINASNEESLSLLQHFAQTIANNVSIMNDQDREKIHLAAVFVNNFTNHLYHLAYDYCKHEQLDFEVLKPLITETAHRINADDPGKMQTGPAVRGNIAVIQKHLKLLENHPDLHKIYLQLSDSIIHQSSMKGTR
jgi:predicted short-subunit dehydrogenase-like oxidoreductase (DUF2520 family)